jgi:hypothetical protein
MPEIVDLDYKSIAFIYEKKQPAAKKEAPATPADNPPAASEEKPIDKLKKLMAEANVTEADIQKVVAGKGHYDISAPIDTYEDRFITGWLMKYWPQIVKLIHPDQKSGS